MTTLPAPNPSERGELFEWLSLLVPADTPPEFSRLSPHVKTEAPKLLGALRLSQRPTQRVLGFTRLALGQITKYRSPGESKLYKDWRSLSSEGAEARLNATRWPSIEKLEALAEEADPATLVVSGIEAVRRNDFPTMEVTSSSHSEDGEHHYLRSEYGRLTTGYIAMLQSIHGGLQGSLTTPTDSPSLRDASGF